MAALVDSFAPVGVPYPSTIIPLAATPQQRVLSSPQVSFKPVHDEPNAPFGGYTGTGLRGGGSSLRHLKLSSPAYWNENSV